MISRLLGRGKVWSFALYALDEEFTPDVKLERPLTLFNSKRLRLFGPQPHTRADPFLLVDGDTLFIFYERVYPGEVGHIACISTTDLQSFEDRGNVLDQPWHLSWPFVFKESGDIYMMPESQQAEEVALYRFAGLPGPLTKVRALIQGHYADPVLIHQDGLWFLFVTSDRGLELFTAADLLTDEFRPHPASPVTSDRRHSRSGGPPIRAGGALLRIAQDCSNRYGENVGIVEIERLNANEYSERVIKPDFFERADAWNRDGAHHLCVTSFMGKTIIAADGRQPDYWINKFLPGRRSD